MKFIRRRKIPTITPSATTEQELFEGYDIKFLVIDCHDKTSGGPLDFSIEINGVQVYRNILGRLTGENAYIYGFDISTENLRVGILNLKEITSREIMKPGEIKSVVFKNKGPYPYDVLDITVGEVIEID